MPRNSITERPDPPARGTEDAAKVPSGLSLEGNDPVPIAEHAQKEEQRGQEGRAEEEKEEEEEEEDDEEVNKAVRDIKSECLSSLECKYLPKFRDYATHYHWDSASDEEKKRSGLSVKPDFDIKTTEVGGFYIVEVVEKSRLEKEPEFQGWHDIEPALSRKLGLVMLVTLYCKRVTGE